jgi:hypothetical protein
VPLNQPVARAIVCFFPGTTITKRHQGLSVWAVSACFASTDERGRYGEQARAPSADAPGVRLSIVDARCPFEADVLTAVTAAILVRLFISFTEGLEQALSALDPTDRVRAHNRGLLSPDAAPVSLFLTPVVRRPCFSLDLRFHPDRSPSEGVRRGR